MTNEEIKKKLDYIYSETPEDICNIDDSEYFTNYFNKLDDASKYRIASYEIVDSFMIGNLFDYYIIQFYINQLEIDLLGMNDYFHIQNRNHIISTINHFIYSTSDLIYNLEDHIKEKQEELFEYAMGTTESNYLHEYGKELENTLSYSEEYDIISILKKEEIYHYDNE